MKQFIQNIFKHTCYVCAGLLLVSCGDFLEITPRDIVTENNFWDEKKDVDQMVTGCYTAMQNAAFVNRTVNMVALTNINQLVPVFSGCFCTSTY